MDNFLVEKALKEGNVEFRKFLIGSTNKRLLQDFEKSKDSKVAKKFDLKQFKDKEVQRHIVNFFLEYADKNEIGKDRYLYATYYTYNAILRVAPKIKDCNKNEYIQLLYELCRSPDINKSYIPNVKIIYYSALETLPMEIRLKSDVWKMTWFNINIERSSQGKYHDTLNFMDVGLEENKVLLKKYVYYLLTVSDRSIATIRSLLGDLLRMENILDKPYVEYSSQDVSHIFEVIGKKHIKNNTFNLYISNLNSFFEYLWVNELVDINPCRSEFRKNRYKKVKRYIQTAPSEYVVAQIFKSLKYANSAAVLWFLLIYTTGMRKSEACEIKSNAFEKSENGYFINFYCTKMRKQVCNVIPEALYKMGLEYIDKNSIKAGYLFPSALRIDRPKGSSSFEEHLNRVFSCCNVVEENGSAYKFKPHSFRHLMAKRMFHRNIPTQFIQEQLHHENIEMTLYYIEFSAKDKLDVQKKFYNNKGEVDNIFNENISNPSSLLKLNANTQILPDGICIRPSKLGKCDKANLCITCPNFRTSYQDLEIHKEHRQRIITYLRLAEINDWKPQVETNRKNLALLDSIIANLEKGEE